MGNNRIITYQVKEDTQTFPIEIRDHMEMLRGSISDDWVKPMNRAKFKEVEIKAILGSLKSNKATGPDGIKMEFYKWLKNEDVFVKAIGRAWEQMLERKSQKIGKVQRQL